MAVKSGLRRTIFIHAGVQLALAIFENIKGINILKKQQIDEDDIWYKNPTHSNDVYANVKMYLGIAVSAHDNDEVDFILQIDFLKIPGFFNKKSDEDIQTFINQYLTSYINIITLSYILNLNKNNQIPET